MNEDTDHHVMPEDLEHLSDRNDMSGIIRELGELKPGSIVTEQGIARLFHRQVVSVKRAVQRGELPPPCRLFGINVWTVGELVRVPMPPYSDVDRSRWSLYFGGQRRRPQLFSCASGSGSESGQWPLNLSSPGRGERFSIVKPRGSAAPCATLCSSDLLGLRLLPLANLKKCLHRKNYQATRFQPR